MAATLADGSATTSADRVTVPSVRIDAGAHQLRSVGPEVAPVIAGWLADPVAATGLGLADGQASPERIARLLAELDRVRDHALGIFRQRDDGLAGLYLVRVDPRHAVALLSVVADPALRGQGTATSIAVALVDWLFARGVAKVAARVAATNRPVIDWLTPRVRLEGRLRDELSSPDGRVDLLLFGITRAEWPRRRAAALAMQAARGRDGE